MSKSLRPTRAAVNRIFLGDKSVALCDLGASVRSNQTNTLFFRTIDKKERMLCTRADVLKMAPE